MGSYWELYETLAVPLLPPGGKKEKLKSPKPLRIEQAGLFLCMIFFSVLLFPPYHACCFLLHFLSPLFYLFRVQSQLRDSEGT